MQPYDREVLIVSLEKTFTEDYWDSWEKYYSAFDRSKVQVIADDWHVLMWIKNFAGCEIEAAHALLLKISQIDNDRIIEVAKLAFFSAWGIQLSHRSGEKEGTFIADLTMGLRTGQLKDGAIARSERLSKYNQLLRSERELGSSECVYSGKRFHNGCNL